MENSPWDGQGTGPSQLLPAGSKKREEVEIQADHPFAFFPFPDFGFLVECWQPLFLGYFFSPPDGKSSLPG